MEAGIEMSPYQNMPLAIGLWSVAGIWAIVATILWRKSNKDGLSTLSEDEIINIKQIPETLTRMHIRLKQLRYKEARKPVEKEIVEEIRKNMFLRLGITMEDIEKLISIQEAGNQSEYMNFIFQLSKKIKIKDFDSKHYEELLIYSAAILDNEGIGLQDAITSEKKYIKLVDTLEIQSSNISKSVGDAIIRYKHYSYGINSINLLNDYRIEHYGKNMPSAAEVVTTMFGTHGEEIIMKKRREEVSDAVNMAVCLLMPFSVIYNNNSEYICLNREYITG